MAYRYIGNKTRLLPSLVGAIGELVPAGATVADLMCGTASVSAALRAHGYNVVASDLMTFAVQHAHVRLLMPRAPAFRRLGAGGYDNALVALNALEPIEGFFHREYSEAGSPGAGCKPRGYFTAENAGRIDAVRAWMRAREQAGELGGRETILLRHDLIMAANDVANIAGTYGHYRSTFSRAALKPLHLTRTTFRADGGSHVVLQGRAEELAPDLSADLCYLDPPYMKRQYAANYHLLETLARGDEPEAIGESGLRDWWDQYSDFCSKRLIFDAFASIVGKMDCPVFLVSYSEDGLIPLGVLLEFFSELGQVSTSTIEHTRFRSNASRLGPRVTEYLIRIER